MVKSPGQNMPQFKRKPKPVEAFQWDNTPRNQWPNWARQDNRISVTVTYTGNLEVIAPPVLKTIEGIRTAQATDWVFYEEDNNALRVMTNEKFTGMYEED